MKKSVSLRKIILAWAIAMLVLCVSLGTGNLIAMKSAAEETFSYSYHSDLRDDGDWTAGATAIAGSGTKSYASAYDELKIAYGSAPAPYLSSVWLINPDKTDYTDFTFTMQFRITSYSDTARWFGVMYHAQRITDEKNTKGERVSGYLWDYRVSGANASTSNPGYVTSGDNGFNDVTLTSGPSLTNAEVYHTMTITLSGTTAKYYMDGSLIATVDTSAQDTNLGGAQTSGGFALLVNVLTINIKSCSISEQVMSEEAIGQTQSNLSPIVPSEYSVTDFSAVLDAGDWYQSDKSDTANIAIHEANENGELVVKATSNSSANVYYGSLNIVNPGAVYQDFTISVTFQVTQDSWNDINRWVGLVYHTNAPSTDTPVAGYYMNYRINGRNCYSAINASRAFSDSNEIAAGGALADGTIAPVLSDGQSHTISVAMVGNTAYHYIDGHLVRIAPTAVKDSHLGTTYTSGGFAFIVNGMELKIQKCEILPYASQPSTGAVLDYTLADTYDADCGIVNAPAVVTEVTTQSVLDALIAAAQSDAERPADAILHLNDQMQVIAKNGKALGSFDEIYTAFNHKIIPVVSLSDAATANALIEYLVNVRSILDIAVMSENPALVKAVREACPSIRGIVDYRNTEVDDLYSDVVGRINANLANVAVLPQSLASAENVRYIQARFKTVWVVPDSTDHADLYTSVNSGAYGIVGDYAKIYEVLNSYPENSYTRAPYNVAHRGLAGDSSLVSPSAAPTENSVDAINAAIAAGATHLEIDVHLSADGKIVVMHDPTIDRTTNGTGTIANMNWSDISSFKLLDGQDIPLLEDIFEIVRNAPDVVLVLEMKTGDSALVQAIKSLVGEDGAYADVLSQIIIISFNETGYDMLGDVRDELSTIPTSFITTPPYLANGTSAASVTDSIASLLFTSGYYNSGIDNGYTTPIHQSNTSLNGYDRELNDRGITSWYWTFSSVSAIQEAARFGYVGITNNAATALSDVGYRAEGVSGQSLSSIATGDLIEVLYISYNGEEAAAAGTVFSYERTEKGWIVVAAYTNSIGMTLYTPAFEIAYEDNADAAVALNDYHLRTAIPSLVTGSGTDPDDLYIKAIREEDGILVSVVGFGNFTSDEYIGLVFHTSTVNGTGWAVQTSDLFVTVTAENATYATNYTNFWDGIRAAFSGTNIAATPIYAAYATYFTLEVKIPYSLLPDDSAGAATLDHDRLITLFAMEFNTSNSTRDLIYSAGSDGMRIDGVGSGDPAAQASYYEIPANHSYSEWMLIAQATETESGSRTRTCEECGETQTEIIPMLTDTSEWYRSIVAPTEEQTGKKIYSSYTYGTVEIELPVLSEEDYEIVDTLAPTHADSGYTYYILVSDPSVTFGIEIPALGHSYGGWEITFDPTEDAEGAAERVCEEDGVTETLVLPTLSEQDWTITVLTEPSETQDGTVRYTLKSDETIYVDKTVRYEAPDDGDDDEETAPPDSDDGKKDSGMSAGAIAGLSIGIIAGVGMITVAILLIVRKKRR